MAFVRFARKVCAAGNEGMVVEGKDLYKKLLLCVFGAVLLLHGHVYAHEHADAGGFGFRRRCGSGRTRDRHVCFCSP